MITKKNNELEDTEKKVMDLYKNNEALDTKKMGIEAGYIRGQLETIGAGARRGQNSRSALKWTHYFLDFEK